MSIKVTCPNGHALQVKSEFAGKRASALTAKPASSFPNRKRKPFPKTTFWSCSGRRVCFIARQSPAAGASTSRDPTSPSHPRRRTRKRRSTNRGQSGRFGASGARRSARNAGDYLHFHADCPRCHTQLSEWTFPLPDEKTAQQGSRASCHFLGLRRQGNVIIIRFGEHQILDEATVKKFGDELFHVADRPDCQKLLLNFAGVTGLSSTMLGIMLMLRKKMSQKPGTLKLCQVGPEIMDVFHATKLGQLFEILGSEQQALKAFG